jgi:hypothetical protein
MSSTRFASTRVLRSMGQCYSKGFCYDSSNKGFHSLKDRQYLLFGRSHDGVSPTHPNQCHVRDFPMTMVYYTFLYVRGSFLYIHNDLRLYSMPFLQLLQKKPSTLLFVHLMNHGRQDIAPKPRRSVLVIKFQII